MVFAERPTVKPIDIRLNT